MIEALIERISRHSSHDRNLRLAAVQLLVGSHVDLSISLEKLEYCGISLFRADRKFLVVPSRFCSCGSTEATCVHLVAVAMRGLSGNEIPETEAKFVEEVFRSL